MSTLSQFFNNAGRFRNNRLMYLRAGSYTFTVPNGISEILGVVIGGGGGGKSGTSSTSAPGGGGGGYAQGVIAVTPGQTIAVTVGAGGNGGNGGTNGSSGGTSSVGAFLSCTGGSGGTTAGGTGGAGSTSGVSEAFTSSGGTAANFSTNYQATGGASSGTPFGSGSDSNQPNAQSGSCSGGAGWNGLVARLFLDPSVTVVEGGQGTGSHGTAARTGGSLSFAYGGTGLFADQPASQPGWYIGSTPRIIQSPQSGVSNIWWFPWEIGGSGGAGFVNTVASEGISAGSGGCGAGGGSVYSSQGASIVAGHGGFGGGGGGAAATTTCVSTGGSGGNGGGGGGASAGGGTVCLGGYGGPGAVLIYW